MLKCEGKKKNLVLFCGKMFQSVREIPETHIKQPATTARGRSASAEKSGPWDSLLAYPPVGEAQPRRHWKVRETAFQRKDAQACATEILTHACTCTHMYLYTRILKVRRKSCK